MNLLALHAITNLGGKFISRRYSSSKLPGLPNLVYQFFNNESKFLSEALRMKEDTLSALMDVSELHKTIQNELFDQMDDYNRFTVLLSHHPLAVPWQILFRFFTSLPKVLPLDKQNFLKALIYHNAWDAVWTLVLSGDATLSDLEEITELIYSCLLANRNDKIGIWLALSAAHKAASNNSIYSSIREMFGYKFGIPLDKLDLFHTTITIPTEQLLEEHPHKIKIHNDKFQEHVDLKAFFISKYAQDCSDGELTLQLVMDMCHEDDRLHKIPGFVSLLILKTKSNRLIEFFATQRAALCNEQDLYYLVKMASPEKHYQLFLTFCHSYRKAFIPNDFMVNYFVMQTHLISESIFISLVKMHYRALTIDTFSEIISTLLKLPEGHQILKTMSRRQYEKFVCLVERVILDKKDYRVLFMLLELSSTKGRSSTRQTLRNLGPHKNNIEILMKHKFSEYNLTEIWRYGLRSNLLDNSNTGELFQKTLLRAWNVKKLLRRSRSFDECATEAEFREQFRRATIFERRRLRVRLQAMGQALSLCNASQIAQILNHLWVYLHEGSDFLLFHDNFGKDYILSHLIKYTMKFIFQSNETGEGVSKMRAVLKSLQFDSTVTQTLTFEYVTMYKPNMSLDFLDVSKNELSFLNRAVMEGIEKGILKSQMTKHNRLLLFKEFQEKKTKLGVNTKLSPTTMGLLGNLVFDLADRAENVGELKEFIQVARERGLPIRLIRRWSAKLQTFKTNCE
ncbi:hypothetical protein METBIDRAFT_11058 [Metschnikowia bicuspidata var. bicuspidata NRRL YB-4993]|uniref:Uncharacterized protein n=1 Tax=Metschnikowia bicuspidata var. bicuspidata NRRL YB-4993 TaxID=869754 RepID=A0A1A0HE57_9ASCO|nr:hypothetical protein METBIDRAFT_11058 [Metschnikowia bicuspidata var. bicuspidata NRRL YB-4993]OBA22188.1 hypothetical protein METBIDRAFT_11058 [Metschnikowia bicuspidata var. bicuspidata NRRL YB-4993]